MKILLAEKADKKAIKHFYKINNYSASFMGNDHCYTIKVNDEIVAAVIISKINDVNFLHALVVTSKYQHKGIASLLLSYSSSKHSKLYCFADRSLNRLYRANLFEQIDYTKLPEILLIRFHSYQQKNNNLRAYSN